MGTFPAIKKVVGGLEIATGFDKDRKEYGPGFVSAHAQSSAAEVSVIRPEGDTGLIAAGGGEAVFREARPPGLRLSLHLLHMHTCTHAHTHTRTCTRAHMPCTSCLGITRYLLRAGRQAWLQQVPRAIMIVM